MFRASSVQFPLTHTGCPVFPGSPLLGANPPERAGLPVVRPPAPACCCCFLTAPAAREWAAAS